MMKNIYKLGELTLESIKKDIERKNHILKDLFWECTLTCNAKCKHCGSSAENKKYTDELSTEEIKAAFKQISQDMDAKKIFINVTGGEPLTRKDLFEVMEYAIGLGFRWCLITNGMLLTDEIIEKLAKTKLESMSVSVDGLEETHDKFRGVSGSYRIIINNILKLKKVNFLKHFQVTTVVNKENINELDELYKVMLELEVDTWRLMPIDPIGRANENKDLFLDGKENKKLLEFIKNNKKNGKIELTYGCPGYLGLEYEKEVRKRYFYCRTGISVASILYNGDLYVCPNVPRIPKLIQGNIRLDNFKNVWDNKYIEFRNKDRTKCEECNKCEQWEYCLGEAYHTWNFEENKPNKCTYKMIQYMEE